MKHSKANSAMSSIRPWASDPIITHASYLTSLETLRIAGICLQPFLPSTARRLLDALGVRSDERSWEFTDIGRGTTGDVHSVALFDGKKIEGGSKGESPAWIGNTAVRVSLKPLSVVQGVAYKLKHICSTSV